MRTRSGRSIHASRAPSQPTGEANSSPDTDNDATLRDVNTNEFNTDTMNTPRTRINLVSNKAIPKPPPFTNKSLDELKGWIEVFNGIATHSQWTEKEKIDAFYLNTPPNIRHWIEMRTSDKQATWAMIEDYLIKTQTPTEYLQELEKEMSNCYPKPGETLWEFANRYWELKRKFKKDTPQEKLVEDIIFRLPVETRRSLMPHNIKNLDDLFEVMGELETPILKDQDTKDNKNTTTIHDFTCKTNNNRDKNKAPQNSNRPKNKNITCYSCGKQGHRAADCYTSKRQKNNDDGPFKAPQRRKCTFCGRQGHLESQCWIKNPQNKTRCVYFCNMRSSPVTRHSPLYTQQHTPEIWYHPHDSQTSIITPSIHSRKVFIVCNKQLSKPPPYCLEAECETIEGNKRQWKPIIIDIDSGAFTTFISPELAQITPEPTEPSNVTVETFGKMKLHANLGQKHINIRIRGQSIRLHALINDHLNAHILGGRNLIEQLAPIKIVRGGQILLKSPTNSTPKATTNETQRRREHSPTTGNKQQRQDQERSREGSIFTKLEQFLVAKPIMVQQIQRTICACAISDSEPLFMSIDKDVAQLLRKYPTLWQKLGRTKLARHKIRLTTDRAVQKAPYMVSFKRNEIIREQVAELLREGRIRASFSPYASPVVLVPKKDNSLRLCNDYRELNKITVKDVYPMKNIDYLLACLSTSTFFSITDCMKGFWQIEMHPEDIEKTAFVTLDGKYEWLVMPFGLMNAPATFQRLMDQVLVNLLYKVAAPYVDDTIVHSKTRDEHLKHLDMVFERLAKAGLSINLKKCQFCLPEVKYLGLIINKNGTRPDPDKVESIRKYPVPKDITQVRAFLGLANFYRKFIKDFAQNAKLLHQLTKKNVAFDWQLHHQQAFDTLKEKLSTAPVLSTFDPKLPISVQTDASKLGLGAIIAQDHTSRKDIEAHEPEKVEETQESKTRTKIYEKVVAYASRSLSAAEENYSTTDLEALAVVWAVKKFRHFLDGAPFTVYTDHQALTALLNTKEPSGKYARWIVQLQQYDITIKYRPGVTNKNADALSRAPLQVQSECEEMSVMPVHQVDAADELIKAQKQDVLLAEVRRILQIPLSKRTPGEKSKAVNFEEVDNIIYFKAAKESKQTPRIAVPNEWVPKILQSIHDCSFAGHFGYKKTLKRATSKYYWPNMKKQIKEYTQTCHLCQERNINRQKQQGFLQSIIREEPFELIGVDVVGPLPKTNRNNKYIITAVDVFTRWATTYATNTMNAIDIANFLVEKVFCIHGVPQVILTDRGTNFTAGLTDKLITQMNAKHVCTTSYHPQCNGCNEHFNGTLKTLISKYINKTHDDWDECLPILTCAYNSSVHESTGFSPYYMLFGREWNSPLGSTCKSLVQPHNDMPYIDKVIARFESVREIAHKHDINAKCRQRQYYDKHRQVVTFEIGDLVMIKKPIHQKGLVAKFMIKYVGPFKIVEKRSPILYKVQANSPVARRIDIVHVSQMKKYYARSNVQQKESNENDESNTQKFTWEDDDLTHENVNEPYVLI